MKKLKINTQAKIDSEKNNLIWSNQNLVLTIFLVLSFSVYLFPFNQATLAIPIVFLFICSVIEIFKNRNKLFYSVKILFSKKLIGLSVVIPAIALIGFLLSDDKSIENVVNFFVIYIIGLSALILLLDSKRILEVTIYSMYISGFFCVVLYTILNFKDMFFSLASNIRFTSQSFHFNLIAYIIAGFSGAIVFQLISKKNIILNIILFAISVVIILAAQSRGSLFAILISLFFISVLALAKKIILRKHSTKKKKSSIVFFLVSSLVFLIIFLYLFNYDIRMQIENQYASFFEIVNTKLELSTEYRGIGTGFTGRSDVWNELIGTLDARILFFGNGYRTSIKKFEGADNGYLVVLYENGFICLSVLLLLIFYILLLFIKTYINSQNKKQSAICLTYLYIITTFLANNFVARFLLSVGNPFSAIIIVILFCAPIFIRQLKIVRI